jgi:predicted PurR-regulated permease PerM
MSDPFDIFLGYGWLVGQLILVITIAGISISVARWLNRKRLSREWYFFILIISSILVSQVVAIVLATQQNAQLVNIEQQNTVLNKLQLKAQNVTIQNQELLKTSQHLFLSFIKQNNFTNSSSSNSK